MILSQINIFPIKGLAGFSPDTGVVEERGLRYDRRMMIIDENNTFVTQRENPTLTSLRALVSDGSLQILSKDSGDKLYSFPWPDSGMRSSENERLSVKVWSSIVSANHLSGQHDQFLSDFFGQSYRLVFMDDQSRRLANPEVTGDEVEVSFADGYPFMILSEASLADLNARLDSPVEMIRFKPNMVLSDATAFAEDQFEEIEVGSCRFRVVKKCERCQIPTIDQKTYQFEKEPTKTLSTYRREGNAIVFGVSAIAIGNGEIRRGDKVSPLL